MEKEIREFTIPIRVTFSEKNNIKNKAEKVKRDVSTFMRETALGCQMREKPDKKIIYELIKEMRDVETAIRNIGRTYYNYGFIDEAPLERERQNLRELIAKVKQELL